MGKTWEDNNYCRVSMTEEEAKIFYWMRQYEIIFKKAFDELRPGSLVLHFDTSGKIRKHEFHFSTKVINS
jgi:hypothetical protein